MRAENWPALLNEYVSEAQPFAWGGNDCGLWSAGWVHQCTGQDFRGEWLGKYKTARGAKMRMLKLGFEGVDSVVGAHLFEKPVPLAQRGDLVYHPSQDCLGICNGLKSHFLTADGITAVATAGCRKAWAV